MEHPIILISGGTGIGTSRIAAELANRVGIYSVISTDAIREILRSAIAEGVNPALHTSTYLAGQSENYKRKSRAVQREKVLRGFKTQASAVAVGIHGLIERHLRENSPVIIEGVHIIPQEYDSPLTDRVMQYFIDIPMSVSIEKDCECVPEKHQRENYRRISIIFGKSAGSKHTYEEKRQKFLISPQSTTKDH